MDWQPIETAPKEGGAYAGWGPPILAFGGGALYFAEWCGDRWEDRDGDFPRTPTHWMPLPALPKP